MQGLSRAALNTPPFVGTAYETDTACLHSAIVTPWIHKLHDNQCCWGRNAAKSTAQTARESAPPNPTTLLPPVHLTPVILTVVIHNNITLKHNSATIPQAADVPVTLLPAHLTPWVTAGAEGMCSAHTQNSSTVFLLSWSLSQPLLNCLLKRVEERSMERRQKVLLLTNLPQSKYVWNKFSLHCVSQNHRVTRVATSGDHPVQPPCQGSATQSRLHRRFECLQIGRLHDLSGHPVSVLCHPQCKKVPF